MAESSLQQRATARGRSVAVGAGPSSTPFVVPVDELLTRNFVVRCTRYASLKQLLRASGRDGLDDRPELTEASSRTFDAFIASCSCFPNWRAMLREARSEWMIRRLGFVFNLQP